MTDQLIAPVIPSTAGPARRRPGRAGAGRPLPLASPLAVPLGAVYGVRDIQIIIISPADWPTRHNGCCPPCSLHLRHVRILPTPGRPYIHAALTCRDGAGTGYVHSRTRARSRLTCIHR
jgi:hypothetical protein